MTYALHIAAESPADDPVSDPLERLLDDHYRQESISHILERLARNPRHSVSADELEEVYGCLKDDLPAHMADEEADLLPLLGRRSHVGDGFGDMTATLRRGHEEQKRLSAELLPELDRLIAGQPLSRPIEFFADAVRFARLVRRNVAWENAVLIPLARQRLKPPDLPFLGDKMARRRSPSLGRG